MRASEQASNGEFGMQLAVYRARRRLLVSLLGWPENRQVPSVDGALVGSTGVCGCVWASLMGRLGACCWSELDKLRVTARS